MFSDSTDTASAEKAGAGLGRPFGAERLVGLMASPPHGHTGGVLVSHILPGPEQNWLLPDIWLHMLRLKKKNKPKTPPTNKQQNALLKRSLVFPGSGLTAQENIARVLERE